MFKTIIAGATAASLAFTAPAQAGGLSEDQIGKLLFGLVATAAIVQLIDNNGQVRTTVKTDPKPILRKPNNGVFSLMQHRARLTLPARCLKTLQTRQREVRMFTRACIDRHYNFRANFPQHCEISVRTANGRRNGWAARCMRQAGYKVDRPRLR